MGVFNYTVTHWGLPQAMRYTALIKAACAALAEAPQQGRAVPTFDQATDGAVSSSMSSISGQSAMALPLSESCISAWMRSATTCTHDGEIQAAGKGLPLPTRKSGVVGIWVRRIVSLTYRRRDEL